VIRQPLTLFIFFLGHLGVVQPHLRVTEPLSWLLGVVCPPSQSLFSLFLAILIRGDSTTHSIFIFGHLGVVRSHPSTIFEGDRTTLMASGSGLSTLTIIIIVILGHLMMVQPLACISTCRQFKIIARLILYLKALFIM
jgi:hypothetical protein